MRLLLHLLLLLLAAVGGTDADISIVWVTQPKAVKYNVGSTTFAWSNITAPVTIVAFTINADGSRGNATALFHGATFPGPSMEWTHNNDDGLKSDASYVFKLQGPNGAESNVTETPISVSGPERSAPENQDSSTSLVAAQSQSSTASSTQQPQAPSSSSLTTTTTTTTTTTSSKTEEPPSSSSTTSPPAAAALPAAASLSTSSQSQQQQQPSSANPPPAVKSSSEEKTSSGQPSQATKTSSPNSPPSPSTTTTTTTTTSPSAPSKNSDAAKTSTATSSSSSDQASSTSPTSQGTAAVTTTTTTTTDSESSDTANLASSSTTVVSAVDPSDASLVAPTMGVQGGQTAKNGKTKSTSTSSKGASATGDGNDETPAASATRTKNIAVGVVSSCVGLAVIAGIVYFLWRRRQPNRVSKQPDWVRQSDMIHVGDVRVAREPNKIKQAMNKYKSMMPGAVSAFKNVFHQPTPDTPLLADKGTFSVTRAPGPQPPLPSATPRGSYPLSPDAINSPYSPDAHNVPYQTNNLGSPYTLHNRVDSPYGAAASPPQPGPVEMAGARPPLKVANASVAPSIHQGAPSVVPIDGMVGFSEIHFTPEETGDGHVSMRRLNPHQMNPYNGLGSGYMSQPTAANPMPAVPAHLRSHVARPMHSARGGFGAGLMSPSDGSTLRQTARERYFGIRQSGVSSKPRTSLFQSRWSRSVATARPNILQEYVPEPVTRMMRGLVQAFTGKAEEGAARPNSRLYPLGMENSDSEKMSEKLSASVASWHDEDHNQFEKLSDVTAGEDFSGRYS